MKAESMPVEIHLPPLTEAAAVTFHDFLTELLLLVESHDFAQIHRFYEHQLEDPFSNSLVQPNPGVLPADDGLPF